MRLLSLLATAALLTAGAGTGTAVATAPTGAAGCLADTEVLVPPPNFAGIPYDTDTSAITPSHSAFEAAVYLSPCIGTDTSMTVSRPDGSRKHQAKLNNICDYADCGQGYQWGTDNLPNATATGIWRITEITSGGQTATLTNATTVILKRATTVTLSANVIVPSKPRATGTVKYWTAQGVQAPSPARRVNIWTWIDGNPHTIASTTTDRDGRYSVALPVNDGAYVAAAVPSTSTLGWVVSNQTRARVLHPTTITGTAAPTSGTVIHNGTKLSTYGHLTVLNNAGNPIPAAGKTVVVQTRPKANPSAGYSTVAIATTTSTGYYYTNWNATVDADVRVAFLSPYETITSSFRWIRAIDVR